MASIQQISNAVALYIKDVFGNTRQVIKGKVGEVPAPASPYAMYWVEGIELSDHTVNTPLDDQLNDNQIVSSRATPITYGINVVGGDDAHNDAIVLSLAARASKRRFDLYKVCGFVGATQVINLSALETGTMRGRAQFMLSVSAALDFEIYEGTIGSVDIGLNELTIPHSETIRIDERVNPNGECN